MVDVLMYLGISSAALIFIFLILLLLLVTRPVKKNKDSSVNKDLMNIREQIDAEAEVY